MLKPIIFLLLILLALDWLFFQARELVPGVTVHPLGPCDVSWYSKGNSLVLACPRHDMIRLWPLPVPSSWFEDGAPGEETARNECVDAGLVEEPGGRPTALTLSSQPSSLYLGLDQSGLIEGASLQPKEHPPSAKGRCWSARRISTRPPRLVRGRFE